jgi:predicted nucleic acid-binding protein
VRFFDASALVKRYVREPESAQVRRLLRSADVAVSRLSEVEVVSALARLTRGRGISIAQRDRAVATFVSDLDAWYVVEVNRAVVATARRLLLQHPVRAGDAVQVAAALHLQAGIGTALQAFVAFDHRVLEAARAEQLIVEFG